VLVVHVAVVALLGALDLAVAAALDVAAAAAERHEHADEERPHLDSANRMWRLTEKYSSETANASRSLRRSRAARGGGASSSTVMTRATAPRSPVAASAARLAPRPIAFGGCALSRASQGWSAAKISEIARSPRGCASDFCQISSVSRRRGAA